MSTFLCTSLFFLLPPPTHNPNRGIQPNTICSAIRTIEKLGGRVERDPGSPGNPVVGVNLYAANRNYSSKNIRCLTRFRKLRTLSMCGMCVGDRHLEIVGQLTSLKYLKLFQVDATDHGIQALANLPHLETLELGHCYKVTDKGVEGLKELAKLHTISLDQMEITGSCFDKMKCKNTLKTLELRHAYWFTDEGVSNLAHFPKLQTVLLYGANVTDKGLEHLKQLCQLEVLGLSDTRVTEKGVKHFQKTRPEVCVYP